MSESSIMSESPILPRRGDVPQQPVENQVVSKKAPTITKTALCALAALVLIGITVASAVAFKGNIQGKEGFFFKKIGSLDAAIPTMVVGAFFGLGFAAFSIYLGIRRSKLVNDETKPNEPPKVPNDDKDEEPATDPADPDNLLLDPNQESQQPSDVEDAEDREVNDPPEAPNDDKGVEDEEPATDPKGLENPHLEVNQGSQQPSGVEDAQDRGVKDQPHPASTIDDNPLFKKGDGKYVADKMLERLANGLPVNATVAHELLEDSNKQLVPYGPPSTSASVSSVAVNSDSQGFESGEELVLESDCKEEEEAATDGSQSHVEAVTNKIVDDLVDDLVEDAVQFVVNAKAQKNTQDAASDLENSDIIRVGSVDSTFGLQESGEESEEEAAPVQSDSE